MSLLIYGNSSKRMQKNEPAKIQNMILLQKVLFPSCLIIEIL